MVTLSTSSVRSSLESKCLYFKQVDIIKKEKKFNLMLTCCPLYRADYTQYLLGCRS